ncbi:MAG: hypothetical protein JOY99_01955 [Sphingomonadaceae bacterium]|nr:hypothetical protein [Sphingomonadaceae bacterium]
MRSLAVSLLLVAPAALAPAEPPVLLPPGYMTADAALALMHQLSAQLLASPSATLTLERWCADHRLAEVPKVVAMVERGAIRAPTPDQIARLQLGPDDRIGYRHVRLMCGARTLSEAENWYVASRLTPAMNDALAASDVPYGKLILPLKPKRRSLGVEMLWSPPAGARDRPLALPQALFRHRALVLDGQGRPLAEVAETYTSQNLASLSAR